MTLKTRKPTGAVPWPLVLIEGEEKAGKTWACAEFTASPKVGRCFWIDLGEGAADEYGVIPGADYEVVEHDGSFAGLYEAVAEIHTLATKALADGEKPAVLIIDTMTSEWDLLKDWAGDRARSSKSNRRKLEADPNAEITISGNYWNDANARHRQLMRLLKRFPGIALMTSHGKSVAVIGADGQPVEGKKEHKVEAQKTLGADATCWIRLFRTQAGVIVGGRSAHLQFRPGEDPKPLAADWTLERIIFDVLKCDPAKAHVRDLVEPKNEAVTPEQIRDEALRPAVGFERVRELYAEAKRLCYDDVELMNETGDEERLLDLLFRIGKERGGGGPGGPGGDDGAAVNGHRSGPPGPAPVSRVRTEDRGVKPVPTGGGDDGEWVAGWNQRLAAVTDPGALPGLQRQIGAAIQSRKITASTGSELATAIRERRNELQGAAA